MARDRNLLDVSSGDGRIISSEDSSDDPQSFEFYRNRGWAAAPNSDSDVTIDMMAAVVNLMPDLNLAEFSVQENPAALAAFCAIHSPSRHQTGTSYHFPWLHQ